MNTWRLTLASLRHHRRTSLAVLAGAALTAGLLTGALSVGDSVRGSLREQALARIGRADLVLATEGRTFRASLADDLAAGLAQAELAPLFSLRASARAEDGGRRANDVRLHGVDERFFALAPDPGAASPPPPGRVHLSARLARQLDAAPGDSLVLRVEKPSALPRDMILASTEDATRALRLVVGEVLGDPAFGRFDLRASQVPPYAAYVDLAWLSGELELEARANRLLLSDPDPDPDQRLARAHRVLRQVWTLDDGQLEVRRDRERGLFELRTPRVFLDAQVAMRAGSIARDLPLLGVLTYFVNELRNGERATPYSMVSAVGPLGSSARPGELPVPEDLASDEVVIHRWLADDLALGAGQHLTLSYFVPGADRALEVAERTLRVRGVIPMTGFAADPSLMPDLPGLGDAENCRDWQTGVPVELAAIRDVDEQYWDEYQGTPKAFLGLKSGQELWAGPFGSLTAVRGPLENAEEFAQRLRDELEPRDLGLYFQDLRGPALSSGTSATDFGGLFLGLSMFLIGSALLLTAMLFSFGVDQRRTEIGALLALGLRPRGVRRLFLRETLILALAGGVLGALLGRLYTGAVLRGLATVWRDAVGDTVLHDHAKLGSIVGGALGAALMAWLATLLGLKRAVSETPRTLLAGDATRGSEQVFVGRGRVATVVSIVALLGALGLAFSGRQGAAAAGAFFGAGVLVLASGLAALRVWLLRQGRHPAALDRMGDLALRNTGRRPGRSMSVAAFLAAGTFLVLSIGVHKQRGVPDAGDRASGTGGFQLYAESSLPVYDDPRSAEGRRALGLDPELEGVAFVPMRVRPGDDASCKNLAQPSLPRLLGVDAEELERRGAFSFGRTLYTVGESSPWTLLRGQEPDGALPAFADAASAQWVMKKKLGDDFEYVDEVGRPFRVRLVGLVTNSILQGSLIIAEDAYQRRFPSDSGYRAFLVDAPVAELQEVSEELSFALADSGLEVVPSGRRLAEFQAVQNTYLDVFQVLGALGVLLGSLGLWIVVLRSALERRGELATLEALGFRPRDLRGLLVREHGFLLLAGLAIGVLAACVALLPVWRGASIGSPPPGVLVLVGLLLVGGFVWVLLAARVAMGGPLLAALREE